MNKPAPNREGSQAAIPTTLWYILKNVAKVMISIPDELLGRLDDHARRSGTTRSGLLRTLAEQELRADLRGRAIRKVLATASPHGGENARHVRELRRAR